MTCINPTKTLKNDYRFTPLQSCKPLDCVTKERSVFMLNGTEYERTIHERVIWRNGPRGCTHLAYFVIINGTFYEVEEW